MWPREPAPRVGRTAGAIGSLRRVPRRGLLGVVAPEIRRTCIGCDFQEVDELVREARPEAFVDIFDLQ
jgi:hypothetical protein